MGKGGIVTTDNLFIERLWRTVKYEEVYLKAYQDGRDARLRIGDHFRFYNAECPHTRPWAIEHQPRYLPQSRCKLPVEVW